MADLLRLGSPQSISPADVGFNECIRVEQDKRTWWTSYCIDLMVCTELGVSPIHEKNRKRLDLPSNNGLDPYQNQFFDAQLLKAQIELCQIRLQVIETVTTRLQKGALEGLQPVLSPCLTAIQNWRGDLPIKLSFDFDNGIPQKLATSTLLRSVASLYLRYHQVQIRTRGGYWIMLTVRSA